MENQIKNFTINFFKNLGSQIQEKQDTLLVTSIPEKFEKFFGKQGPYTLVFDLSKSANGELVAKGSYMLKAMKSFLENSGSTTLLKMNFNIYPEKEIQKHIKLKNCEINKLTKKFKNKFFTRFTFQTNLQYLNKKETLINHIFVHEGEVIDGDLNDYDVSEGNKKDLIVEGVKEDYEIAKADLQEKLQPKIKEISEVLETQLEKELSRIKAHYQNRILESTEAIQTNAEKIKYLQEQKAKLIRRPSSASTSTNANAPREDLEREGNKFDERIQRHQTIIENIKKDGKLKDFEEKEKFEIQSEKSKHNIDIRNKLINTTIIYYPIFTFDIFLKKDKTGRIVEISYNPLTHEFSEFFCESCNSKINKLSLCSSGHIACENCLSNCGNCGKEFCKKCITKTCNICGKEICKDCTITCFSCGKTVCKSHAQVDSLSGKTYCKNCLKYCPKCFQNKDPKYFKTSSDNTQICAQCFAKEQAQKAVKGIFRNN